MIIVQTTMRAPPNQPYLPCLVHVPGKRFPFHSNLPSPLIPRFQHLALAQMVLSTSATGRSCLLHSVQNTRILTAVPQSNISKRGKDLIPIKDERGTDAGFAKLTQAISVPCATFGIVIQTLLVDTASHYTKLTRSEKRGNFNGSHYSHVQDFIQEEEEGHGENVER